MLPTIFLALCIITLVAAAILDILKQEVEWWVLLGAVVFALLYGLMKADVKQLGLAIFVGTIIPFLLAFLSRQKWMGYGDSMFAIAGSALVSFPGAVVATTSAFLVGAVFGIIFLKAKPNVKTMPFGPFLVIGALIALVFGEQIERFLINL